MGIVNVDPAAPNMCTTPETGGIATYDDNLCLHTGDAEIDTTSEDYCDDAVANVYIVEQMISSTLSDTGTLSPDENGIVAIESDPPQSTESNYNPHELVTASWVNVFNYNSGVPSHIANSTIHITSTERTRWNNTYTKEESYDRTEIDTMIEETASVNDVAILALESQLTRDASITGLSDNIIIETFINIDDITLSSGNYNSANRRLEC